jgi:hypothetical protein
VQDLRAQARKPARTLPVARLVPNGPNDSATLAPTKARLVRGLKAAGNSVPAIAKETGLSTVEVAAILTFGRG